MTANNSKNEMVKINQYFHKCDKLNLVEETTVSKLMWLIFYQLENKTTEYKNTRNYSHSVTTSFIEGINEKVLISMQEKAMKSGITLFNPTITDLLICPCDKSDQELGYDPDWGLICKVCSIMSGDIFHLAFMFMIRRKWPVCKSTSSLVTYFQSMVMNMALFWKINHLPSYSVTTDTTAKVVKAIEFFKDFWASEKISFTPESQYYEVVFLPEPLVPVPRSECSDLNELISKFARTLTKSITGLSKIERAAYLKVVSENEFSDFKRMSSLGPVTPSKILQNLI